MLCGEGRCLRAVGGEVGGRRPERDAEERREMALVGEVLLLERGAEGVEGRSSTRGRSSESMMWIESRGSLVLLGEGS